MGSVFGKVYLAIICIWFGWCHGAEFFKLTTRLTIHFPIKSSSKTVSSRYYNKWYVCGHDNCYITLLNLKFGASWISCVHSSCHYAITLCSVILHGYMGVRYSPVHNKLLILWIHIPTKDALSTVLSLNVIAWPLWQPAAYMHTWRSVCYNTTNPAADHE